MKEIIGSICSFGDLIVTEQLIGNLASVIKNEQDEMFIEYYCDANSTLTRYILVQTDLTKVNLLKNNVESITNTIKTSFDLYKKIYITDCNSEYCIVKCVEFEDIEEYLPEPDVFLCD